MRVLIGVMGPGEQATAADCDLAYALGQAIARSGWVLLTGGRACGVMDAASRGAKSANGLTVGILPTGDYASCSAAVDIPILTGLGQARNVINVLSSQVIVACGMGAGTASEVALALKTKPPVILLNTTPESQAFFQSLSPDRVLIAPDVATAIGQIASLLAQAG